MKLYLFGLPRLAALDGRVHPLQEKDAAMLALIAIDGPLARSRVAALLWPAVDSSKAANNLRQRLFRLRRLAGADLVVQGRLLSLAPSITHDLPDADHIEATLRRDPASLSGELLGTRDVDDGGELAVWLRDVRARWRTRRDDAIARLEDAGYRIRGSTAAPDLCGADAVRSIGQRLAVASAPAQQLAVMAAVCGDGFMPQLVASALGATPIQLVAPWQQLVELGLFDGQGFIDAAAGPSILAQVPAGLLPLLEAATEASVRPPTPRSTDPSPDVFRRDWRAAHRAVEDESIQRAIALAERLSTHASTIVECAMALELRARILVGRCDVAAVDAAGDAVNLALEAGDRALAASARHQLGCALWIAGRPREALDALSLAVAAVDLLDDGRRRVLAADRAWVMARLDVGVVEKAAA